MRTTLLKHIIFLFVLTVTVFSCFEEDERISPHQPGEEKISLIEQSIYHYQSYYDLGTNSVIKSNSNADWALGFEASEKDWHIIVNTSNYWGVCRTGIYDIEVSNYQLNPSGWKFDKSDGNLDSTAVGQWVIFEEEDTIYSNEVIIFGQYNGIRYDPIWKAIFLSVDDAKYSFKYAPYMGGSVIEYTLFKDTDFNFNHFSFKDNGITLSIEPGKNEWDLLFTQFGSILYTDDGIPTPYYVRGVYLNPAGVVSALDSVKSFTDIIFEDISGYNFSNQQDFIGYKWKDVTIDFQSNTAVYTVRSNYTYIIRDISGFYYKLRFISYYNDLGEKGFPVFEFVRL